MNDNSINKLGRNYFGLKLVVVFGLMFLLLIPTVLIINLVDEREQRRDEAAIAVGSKWGSNQTIVGPIISVPYIENEITQYAHFLPDRLVINGSLTPNILQRGIYEINAYNTNLSFAGEFAPLNVNELNINPALLRWNDALISIGITDVRGLNEDVVVKWNDQELMLNSSNSVNIERINSKISTKLTSFNPQQIYQYSFDLKLNGIKALNFSPVAKETLVSLNSSWDNPSFDGAFLPDQREINDLGFKADWKILAVNRNLSQQWTSKTGNQFDDASFGVRLLVPVDHYQKSMRSAKYAILVIALTFLIFFFVEALNKKRIHPFQYILVGLALVLFFSLLLALSEHLNFNLAYLIAGVSTISAITLYSFSIFKNQKLSIIQTICLLIIYSFIFVIIQLQDYALLVGNIGLFIVLALIMYISRKIDWYKIDKTGEDQ